MPRNFPYLGLIEWLFPGTRAIHCRRAPRDTCLSIYTNDLLITHGYDQVRQPLYGGSIGRWHHYERHLELLLKVLDIPSP